MMKSEVRIRIVSADNAAVLHAFNDSGIAVTKLQIIDELTAELVIAESDRKRAALIAKKKGAQLKLRRARGTAALAGRLIKRPFLLACALVLLGLTFWLPTRILFIRVEGNVLVPDRLILETAARQGICFGAERRDVRSEKMKNALLEEMPQLQWAGINTEGCVAVICVKERELTQERKEAAGVTRIVAARDALVESVTVTRGTAACKPGGVVKEGQLLISGYTDCGLSIRADRAQGEVFGRSRRDLAVVMPSEVTLRGEESGRNTIYSLMIGKKQINFSKDSGILDRTCDRMYAEYYVTLPGGFRLPVRFAVETRIYYDCLQRHTSQEEATLQLSDFASRYLAQQMVAGQILHRCENVTQEEGVFQLSGDYTCREMIGREQQEEIITPYGKHD